MSNYTITLPYYLVDERQHGRRHARVVWAVADEVLQRSAAAVDGAVGGAVGWCAGQRAVGAEHGEQQAAVAALQVSGGAVAESR